MALFEPTSSKIRLLNYLVLSLRLEILELETGYFMEISINTRRSSPNCSLLKCSNPQIGSESRRSAEINHKSTIFSMTIWSDGMKD